METEINTSKQLKFMSKDLRETIIPRTEGQNTLLSNRTDEPRRLSNSQRNPCVSLLGKNKRNSFCNLDTF